MILQGISKKYILFIPSHENNRKIQKNISYIFSSYCHWFRRYVYNMDILFDLIPHRMLAMPVCIMIKKIIKGFSSLSFSKSYASISLNILFMANERLFLGNGNTYKSTTTFLIDYFDLAYSLIKLTPSIVLWIHKVQN